MLFDCCLLFAARLLTLAVDRATLRISSQHIANWLHHGLVTQDDVINSFQKMAAVVDRQNAGSAGYEPMCANFNSPFTGFVCALEMVWRGKDEGIIAM